MAQRTFTRVRSLESTFLLCVCRIACTTFGISFSTKGLSSGCEKASMIRHKKKKRSMGKYHIILIKLLALSLLAALEAQLLYLISNSQSCRPKIWFRLQRSEIGGTYRQGRDRPCHRCLFESYRQGRPRSSVLHSNKVVHRVWHLRSLNL